MCTSYGIVLHKKKKKKGSWEMWCCPTVFILCDSFFLFIMIIYHHIPQYITKSPRFIYIHTPGFIPLFFFLSTIMDSLSNNHDLPSPPYKNWKVWEKSYKKAINFPFTFTFPSLFLYFLTSILFFSLIYLHVTQYTFFFFLLVL